MKKIEEPNAFEKFYNCSAAIALNNDKLMITGGGSPPQAQVRTYTVST